ncbi:MAG: DinB superfamily protein [Acidobacteria bacterium]|nr:DinB superfamily protein [Acidobacteriota bacterium]
MAMKDALLPEFDHEMAVTRKVLERVPDEKFAWAPHEKSMTLGRLAGHIADIPSWVKETLTRDSIDLSGDYTPNVPATRAQVLETFDRMVAEARPLIDATTDAQFMSMWTLKSKDQEMFSAPKAAVLRSFVFSHLVHHRGQMTVYLRLTGVPVPSIYGPSADEAN